jgi:hypothetical protein
MFGTGIHREGWRRRLLPGRYQCQMNAVFGTDLGQSAPPLIASSVTRALTSAVPRLCVTLPIARP